MLTAHTHRLAKKSRLLPSSLHVLFAPAHLPVALGTGRGTLGDGRMPANSISRGWFPFFSLPRILQAGSCPPVGMWPSAFPGSGARPGPWGLQEQKSWPQPVQFSLAGHARPFSCLRQDSGLLSIHFSFSFPLAVLLFELIWMDEPAALSGI